jgi:hypothetical protein
VKRSEPRDSSEHELFYLEIPYTASFDPLDGFNDTILEDEEIPREPAGLSDDQVSMLAQDSLEDNQPAPDQGQDEDISAPANRPE